MNGTETRHSDYQTSTEPRQVPTPEPSKLIIELTNLGEGTLRTVKRELKAIIEDYGYRKMISGCIRVTDEGDKLTGLTFPIPQPPIAKAKELKEEVLGVKGDE